MYNIHDIPQSAYSNPSNQFNGKFYIGLPALSSNYVSLSNSGFAYSDAVKKNGDSLLLDFNSLLNELQDDNYTSFNTKIDLFSFGFRLSDRTQLTFNVTENAYFKFTYTKDFLEFIYRGNGAFQNSVANFDGLGISLNHYREYGVGLSHQLTKKLRIGGRAKYLYGMENIYSERSEITLATDPNTFALTGKANINVQTSGLDDVDDDESTSDYLFGRGNSGFGLDLGGHYEINEKLSVNASVLDLGFINWNFKTTSYKIDDGQYTYSGIEIDAFAEDSDGGNATDDGETSFDRVLDSLEEAFAIDTSNGGYTAPLTSRFYIGANYKLNEKMLVGGLIQSEVFQGQILPSFTFNVNRKMTKWISLAASYTIINNSYNNLGVGINVNPGPVQFYIVSDNILGAIQPQHARHAQVRVGINLIFGSDKTTQIHPSFKGSLKKDKDKEEDTEEEEEEEESESENE